MRKSFVFIALLIISCNSIERRDEKLLATIYDYMSENLDKNKVQKINNVTILQVDSLTEKGKLYLYTQFLKETISQYEKFLKSDSDSYKRNVEAVNKYKGIISTEYEEKWAKEALESIQKDITILNKWKNKFDSVNVVYNSSDGEKFKWYKVEYKIAYTDSDIKDTITNDIYIDKDYMVMKGTRNISEYIADKEEYRKIFNNTK